MAKYVLSTPTKHCNKITEIHTSETQTKNKKKKQSNGK